MRTPALSPHSCAAAFKASPSTPALIAMVKEGGAFVQPAPIDSSSDASSNRLPVLRIQHGQVLIFDLPLRLTMLLHGDILKLASTQEKPVLKSLRNFAR